MSKKVRKFSPEFKLAAVLESYATQDIAGTANRIGVHITQLNNWRKKLKEEGGKIFESRKGKNQHTAVKREEELEKIIGRQTIEIQTLKKISELLS